MAFGGRLVAGGIAAGAALAYYVQRRRARTGDAYVVIIRQLPSDARRWAVDANRRAGLAFDEGTSAARAREAEFVEQLSAASARPSTDV